MAVRGASAKGSACNHRLIINNQQQIFSVSLMKGAKAIRTCIVFCSACVSQHFRITSSLEFNYERARIGVIPYDLAAQVSQTPMSSIGPPILLPHMSSLMLMKPFFNVTMVGSDDTAQQSMIGLTQVRWGWRRANLQSKSRHPIWLEHRQTTSHMTAPFFFFLFFSSVVVSHFMAAIYSV